MREGSDVRYGNKNVEGFQQGALIHVFTNEVPLCYPGTKTYRVELDDSSVIN